MGSSTSKMVEIIITAINQIKIVITMKIIEKSNENTLLKLTNEWKRNLWIINDIAIELVINISLNGAC